MLHIQIFLFLPFIAVFLATFPTESSDTKMERNKEKFDSFQKNNFKELNKLIILAVLMYFYSFTLMNKHILFVLVKHTVQSDYNTAVQFHDIIKEADCMNSICD